MNYPPEIRLLAREEFGTPKDIAIGTTLLGKTSELETAAKTYGIELVVNEQGFIGNINHGQAMDLVREVGLQHPLSMHTLALGEALATYEAMDLSGARLDHTTQEEVFYQNFRPPSWKAEWFDERYSKDGEVTHVSYHLPSGRLHSEIFSGSTQYQTITFPSPSLKRGIFKTPNLTVNFAYYPPINGSVAWLDADSGWVVLGCYGDPSGSIAALGVRSVRLLDNIAQI